MTSTGRPECAAAPRPPATTARTLAFLGANAIFRHIRLQPSPIGQDREEVNYKPWSAGDDPAWRTDPAEVTTDWREPPINDPESRLLGALYECNPVDAAGVVVGPAGWLFSGTGVRAGTVLPGLVGSEYDRVQAGRHGRPGSSCCCTRRSAAGDTPASRTRPTTPPQVGPGYSTAVPAPGSASSGPPARPATARR